MVKSRSWVCSGYVAILLVTLKQRKSLPADAVGLDYVDILYQSGWYRYFEFAGHVTYDWFDTGYHYQ
jgi:hypothetical protein